MKKKSIILLIFLIALVFCLTGCSNNKEQEQMKEKAKAEIEYFDKKILGLANKLNNISFTSYILTEDKANADTSKSEGKNSEVAKSSEDMGNSGESKESSSSGGDRSSQENESYTKYNLKMQGILNNNDTSIDWEYMKATIENIYTSWTDAIIDLHSMNIQNQDILSFGRVLDELIIAIKKQDKVNTLNRLAELYSYLPKFKAQIGEEETKINLAYTEFYVMNSYVLSEQNNWAEMKKQIAMAQEYFAKVMNESNNSSKLYILLNDLNNSIDTQDKELFYIKYISTIEGIEKM